MLANVLLGHQGYKRFQEQKLDDGKTDGVRISTNLLKRTIERGKRSKIQSLNEKCMKRAIRG